MICLYSNKSCSSFVVLCPVRDKNVTVHFCHAHSYLVFRHEPCSHISHGIQSYPHSHFLPYHCHMVAEAIICMHGLFYWLVSFVAVENILSREETVGVTLCLLDTTKHR
jgi:hypothetical protein